MSSFSTAARDDTLHLSVVSEPRGCDFLAGSEPFSIRPGKITSHFPRWPDLLRAHRPDHPTLALQVMVNTF